MKLVMIESPFRGANGNYSFNRAYARACLLDSLRRGGEAPFAMHLLYPQVLDDTMLAERDQGISSGLAWAARAELVAVYEDLGVTEGMLRAIERAKERCIPVERRTGVWDATKICRMCFGARRVESPETAPCFYCVPEAR